MAKDKRAAPLSLVKQKSAPPKKDEAQAVNEARRADEVRPQDAVASSPHGDNTNPNAYSAESARKLGNAATYSINEPPSGAPKPFKVPEDHTVTSPETLAQDYPDGYVPPEPPPEEVEVDGEGTDNMATNSRFTDDSDDLEDEIDQARRDGDFKPMHRSHPKKRK